MVGKTLSNHELAEIYNKKQMLIGNILEYELLDGDKVELVDVRDKENSGKLVIPSFITSYRIKRIGGYSYSPLSFCKFSDVYIYKQ